MTHIGQTADLLPSVPSFHRHPPGAGDGLGAVLSLLRAAREPAEQVFLSLGASLTQAVGLIQRAADTVAEMSSRLEGDEFGTALASLTEAAGEVTALARSAGGEKAALTELDNTIEGVSRGIARFRKTVAEVELLAVNAKIQVSHLPVSNADFVTFTQDMGALADNAGTGLELLDGKLAMLARSVRTALLSREAFERDHGLALTAIGDRLHRALQSVERRRAQAMATAKTLAGRSREVGQRIGSAVQALQINDITRQRLEHVEEILEEADDVAAGGHGWGAELSGEDRAQVFAAICKLQAAQTAQANEHFAREMHRLIASLRSLAANAGEIEAEGMSVAGATRDNGESFLAELKTQLADARSLLVSYARAHDDTRAVVRSASAAVADMLTHVETVRSIEADMRIMGLNATFKCGRLGVQGRSLSVIAHELRNCATRTREQAEMVANGLNAMVAISQSLGAGQAGLEGLSAAMDHSTEILSELGANFDRIFDGLIRDTGDVKAILTTAAEGIRIHDDLDQSLREAVRRITALGGAETVDAERIGQLMERVRAEFGGRYTMESERLMHELVLDGTAGAAATATPSAAPEPDPDDFLF